MFINRRRTGTLITQNLFNTAIDFDGGIIPDPIGGADASYSGLTACVTAGADPMNFGNILNLNNDFTVIVSFTNQNATVTGRRFYFLTQSPTGTSAYSSFFIKMESATAFWWSIGGAAQSLPVTSLSKYVFTFRKVGNVFSVWQNGVKKKEWTRSYTFNTTYDYISTDNGTAASYKYKGLSIFKEALSDSEISNLTSTIKVIDLFDSKASSTNILWTFDNNLGRTLVDRGSGLEVTIPDNWELGYVESEYTLQRQGFDIYTDNTAPTDSSKYLIVALKYDGTSFGKTFAGYTFAGTYSQSGNNLLPFGKFKQPIEASLIAKDASNFYYTAGVPKEISFDDLQTAPSYVNYVLQDGKITNLTI